MGEEKEKLMGRSLNRKMEFKRFTVHDDKCAMKIGTDAVLLGSLADHPNPLRIIDVGTGSGIVALMLAQRFPDARIEAIELDENAAIQASENFKRSPFNDRITCHNDSFQNWAENNYKKIEADLIVSNPPFYDGTSKSLDRSRNMARHQDFLSTLDLLKGASSMVNAKTGVIVIVWPVNREGELMTTADRLGMFYNGSYRIKATESHEVTRVVAFYSKRCMNPQNWIDRTIVLEKGVGDSREFTPEYLELVKDFFLKA